MLKLYSGKKTKRIQYLVVFESEYHITKNKCLDMGKFTRLNKNK